MLPVSEENIDLEIDQYNGLGHSKVASYDPMSRKRSYNNTNILGWFFHKG